MTQIKEDKLAQTLVRNLVSSMRRTKKHLQKGNAGFDKNGVMGFAKSGEQLTEQLQDFYSNIEKLQEFGSIKDKVQEPELAAMEEEYEEFMGAIKEYQINLRAASNVSKVFLESAKNNQEKSTRMDHGYNKEGECISDKQILANAPAMTFNNKV